MGDHRFIGYKPWPLSRAFPARAPKVVLMLLLGLALAGCTLVAAEDDTFRAPAVSPPGGGADTLTPSPEPGRPEYVPGRGWTTLKPYRNGDAVDPRTGDVWRGTPHGYTNPSTGDYVPRP